MLLVTERDHPHALGLRIASQVGDRDAGDIVNRVDPVQLQGIDQKVETVRLVADGGGFFFRWNRCHVGYCHFLLSQSDMRDNCVRPCSR